MTVGGEATRFARFVTRGPAVTDCAIFTGAIADDGGYGRFWYGSHPRRVVRAHRYALAQASGGHLPAGVVAMHLCDNPICVRAYACGGGEALARYGPLAGAHVVAGTQRDNLALMARKGRAGTTSLTRAQRTARSRALRDAVRNGWDADAVAAAWFGDTLTLF
ncbi:hypothetical protein FO059_18140 (plasmid) [Tomitella fengzijianii]|uniref:HNH endonuclease n=1 Tax=Tomitella fengzijianii TaxID=2597660 RepID=A0A516X8Z0_9ACTN|nr:hypothetical protein FO059_18140 [Tomitella fengzijianii]